MRRPLPPIPACSRAGHRTGGPQIAQHHPGTDERTPLMSLNQAPIWQAMIERLHDAAATARRICR